MINPGMWGKALIRMPKVSSEEWRGLDVVARWLVITRAAVLTMTFLPCLLMGELALRQHAFDLKLWAIVTLGLLSAHATNNLVNDLTDHLKGTDGGDYFRTQYGLQPLEQGVLTMKGFAVYAVLTGGVALSCGGWLLYTRAGLVLPLFGAGIFFVLFYTYPLKYYGFGELAVILVWGPLMVGGGYYVVTGGWSWPVAVAGTVYALGPTQVIFGKHIDKLAADHAKKIKTLPVVLGEARSRQGVVLMMLVQYALVLYLVATGFFSWPVLVVFLSLGTFTKVARVYRRPRPEAKPTRWRDDIWPLWFSAWSFLHNARFGVLLVVGVAVDLLLHRR
jgi:1,4-dihydroxy-2-naphthoate octaprenyltransferase